ncbi:hypothetical protein GCM10009854_35960 [Saccharopolyspora halophila]|uniref:Uncharacterized protein n=1 Tax=Saccharopolyspora halophila TaxID=405551 RepID=A0ABP5TMI6_9PSEU
MKRSPGIAVRGLPQYRLFSRGPQDTEPSVMALPAKTRLSSGESQPWRERDSTPCRIGHGVQFSTRRQPLLQVWDSARTAAGPQTSSGEDSRDAA